MEQLWGLLSGKVLVCQASKWEKQWVRPRDLPKGLLWAQELDCQ